MLLMKGVAWYCRRHGLYLFEFLLVRAGEFDFRAVHFLASGCGEVTILIFQS